MNIYSLSGLEYAENLRIITFSNNYLTSLEPLKDLKKLTSVGMGRNPGLSIDEILKLKFINELDITGNNHMIKAIDKISVYTNMTYFSIRDTTLADVSFMAEWSELHTLEAAYNAISDLTPLSESSLSLINFEHQLI